MRPDRFAVGVVVLLCTSAVLAGTINPSSATRAQEVDAIIGSGENLVTDQDDDLNTNFNFYSKAISATASTGTAGVDPTNSSNSEQISDILDEQIYAAGTVGGSTAQGSGIGIGAGAINTFEVTFDVFVAAPYTLSGDIDAGTSFFGDSADASFEFDGPGGNIVSVSTSGGVVPIASSGTLTPGTYTIMASASMLGNSFNNTTDALFDFNLQIIPEPSSLMLLALAAGLLRRRG